MHVELKQATTFRYQSKTAVKAAVNTDWLLLSLERTNIYLLRSH